jgi:hypothetical protein
VVFTGDRQQGAEHVRIGNRLRTPIAREVIVEGELVHAFRVGCWQSTCVGVQRVAGADEIGERVSQWSDNRIEPIGYRFRHSGLGSFNFRQATQAGRRPAPTVDVLRLFNAA